MGDRGNVYVHEGDEPGVYLYTHWGGSLLPERVKNALARGQSRWDDTPYLARIIFCEMIGDDVNGTTGYGISTQPTDGHTIIDVDTRNQLINGQTLFNEYIGEQ